MSRQFRSDDTDKWKYGFGLYNDGDKTATTADYDGANAGCSGSSGGTSLTIDAASTFANGDLVLIHQTRGTGVGAWELNKIASGGGTTSLVMVHNLQNTYTDSGASQAQIIEMKSYKDVTVPNGVTWSAPAWDGNKGSIISFFAKTLTVASGGLISANGKGYRGGSSGCFTGNTGEGTTGASVSSQNSANGSGGGAGSGNNHASDEKPHPGGGGGGNGTAGTIGAAGAGPQTRGAAGGTSGNAALTSMTPGGGGGGSATPNTGGWWCGATFMPGVSGGGMVLIFAETITVVGNIRANGADAAAKVNSIMGFGGAGAGGSILLKGKNITLGSSLVTANGGGTGAAGGAGRIHVDYSTSLSGTTSPTLDSTLDATIKAASGSAAVLMTLL